MISSKKEYKEYLNTDKMALGISGAGLDNFLLGIILPNYIWKFQKTLRKAEYLKNCRRSILGEVLFSFYYLRYRRLSLKLGYSIPLNVFGPGLAIAHYGTIVVSAFAKVGKNCRIHPSTCIGASSGTIKAPIIGDNVYIGPGAKIYGGITLGSNIAIAPNAAVNKSFTEENILIGGVPAEKIKSIDITSVIKHLRQ